MNKKLLTKFLAVSLSISLLAGCGSTSTAQSSSSEVAEPALSFNAGTYEAVGKGIHGDVVVSVTVDETSITKVEIISHSETQGIADPAIEKIPEAIVANQSIAIDTIAGATITSNAIIEGATAALTAAGGDLALLSVKPEIVQVKGEDIERTVDVVVVGGGGAGLTAAVSAHQNGAESVLVIEAMPRLGGNTALAGGAYNAVDPARQAMFDIQDSIENHYNNTYEGGDKLGKPELIQTLVENALPSLEWLESIGFETLDYIAFATGGLFPRAHIPAGLAGTDYVNPQIKYLEDANQEIMLETKATELIMEDGKVCGVVATKADGGKVTVHANNGVIIATGGFSANVEMRSAINPILTENVLTTNHPGALGDGLEMAEAVGANLVNIEYIQFFPLADAETGAVESPLALDTSKYFLVNKEGVRFVAEDERRDVQTAAILAQTDGLAFTVVDTDSLTFPDRELPVIEKAIEEGKVFKGDTIEELAINMGMDPEVLVKSVNDYNSYVENNLDPDFGRTVFGEKIDTAPFYATGRTPSVHHTMGGIDINKDAQVLDKNGDAIKGLYAAGEVTGGVHGSNRLGGNALTDVIVFGKIAGASAAQAK